MSGRILVHGTVRDSLCTYEGVLRTLLLVASGVTYPVTLPRTTDRNAHLQLDTH